MAIRARSSDSPVSPLENIHSPSRCRSALSMPILSRRLQVSHIQQTPYPFLEKVVPCVWPRPGIELIFKERTQMADFLKNGVGKFEHAEVVELPERDPGRFRGCIRIIFRRALLESAFTDLFTIYPELSGYLAKEWSTASSLLNKC